MMTSNLQILISGRFLRTIPPPFEWWIAAFWYVLSGTCGIHVFSTLIRSVAVSLFFTVLPDYYTQAKTPARPSQCPLPSNKNFPYYAPVLSLRTDHAQTTITHCLVQIDSLESLAIKWAVGEAGVVNDTVKK